MRPQLTSSENAAVGKAYRVLGLLGSGGMAEVYRAEVTGLEGFKKQVAIKRVRPDLVTDEKFVRMFLDEARLGARLAHSNCVGVFDIGFGHGTFFLVMEYVNGASLRALLDWTARTSRDFPAPEAVYIAKKLCEGLAYAHDLKGEDGVSLGIVHRDVSPPNVLITYHGEIKLADFGLAKATTHLVPDEAGIIKGKYPYLAPEALESSEIDGRADIFAVGSVLWELLSGTKLFDDEYPVRIIRKVQAAVVPPLDGTKPHVDAELDAILAKALTRDRDKRYGSARELARALGGWLAARRLDVGALTVAELVRSYGEAEKNPLEERARISDVLKQELAHKVATMQPVTLETSDWKSLVADSRRGGA